MLGACGVWLEVSTIPGQEHPEALVERLEEEGGRRGDQRGAGVVVLPKEEKLAWGEKTAKV